MTGEQDKGREVGLFLWSHLWPEHLLAMPTALGCFQEMLGSGGVALVGVHRLISTFKMLSLYFCMCCPPYAFVPHGGIRSALV